MRPNSAGGNSSRLKPTLPTQALGSGELATDLFAYRAVDRQGGPRPGKNLFGEDLSRQQGAETGAWFSPSMYNIVKQDGRDVHLVVMPDKGCVVNSGLDTVKNVPFSYAIPEPTTLGAHGMAARCYPEMLALVASGRLRPGELVTREISLEEAARALPAMGGTAHHGITVVRPNP